MMQQKHIHKGVVKENGKVLLPKEILQRLNIKPGDQLCFEQDKNSLGLIMKKEHNRTKEYLTQMKIAQIAKHYTKMKCVIVKDDVVIVATESDIPIGNKILSMKARSITIHGNDYEQQQEPVYLLEETEKYVIKQIFSMKFFKSNLGSLIVYDDDEKTEIKEQTKEFIENIVDFAIGNTCVSREILKEVI